MNAGIFLSRTVNAGGVQLIIAEGKVSPGKKSSGLPKPGRDRQGGVVASDLAMIDP